MELTRLMLQIQIRLKIGHHMAEFREVQRLIAIAEGLLWTRMHFNEQSRPLQPQRPLVKAPGRGCGLQRRGWDRQ